MTPSQYFEEWFDSRPGVNKSNPLHSAIKGSCGAAFLAGYAASEENLIGLLEGMKGEVFPEITTGDYSEHRLYGAWHALNDAITAIKKQEQ